MLFYRIDGNLLNWTEENERSAAAIIQMKSDSFFHERKRKSYAFVSRGNKECLIAGLITKESIPPEEIIEKYLRYAALKADNISVTEITMKEMSMLLRSADRNDFISDDDDVLNSLDIRHLCRQSGGPFVEKMIFSEGCSEKSIISKAEKLLWNQTVQPEIERIFMGSKIDSASGHPVHYIITGDDEKQREEISDMLLCALRANGRINSGRICHMYDLMGVNMVDCIYQICSGGTVIIDCRNDDDGGSDFSIRTVGEITQACAAAKKYRNSVLTVFMLSEGNTRMKNVIKECMSGTLMIELSPNSITKSDAKAYLRRCAKEYGVPANKKLYSVIEDDTSCLTTSMLDKSFNEWLGGRLRNAVYPQYASLSMADALAEPLSEKGDSLAELNGMIGLDEAKRVINRALCYYKAQRIFAEKGMPCEKPAMHMVFTGNPGTAKTTAARLFAKIMAEQGIISNGELVEVGRSDLVGKYVGWTAKIVKNCFKRARGGVLFIDEAYSLVDDREGMYGDEAINTIVQEMENNRDDVIVIFAGYPDKMESFIQRNPGLRSRIAFHVPFSDYTPKELCKIAVHIAEKKGLSVSSEAQDKLVSVFENAVLTEDFGNGRFARNVIEQAQMEQAVRLVKMNPENIAAKEVTTLKPEDIVEIPYAEEQKACIGF